VIPGTNPNLFSQIEYYAFQATLLVVFLAWLLLHLLDTLQAVIIRLRRFWTTVRHELPDEPRKVNPTSP